GLHADGDVAGKADPVALGPESIALVCPVLKCCPAVKVFVAGAQRVDGEVVIKLADLVACFADEGAAIDIESDLVGEVDVAGMVDESPTRAAHHGTAIYDCRRWARADLIEIERIPAARIGAGAGN